MMIWTALITLACHTGSPVDENGKTARLFPKSPLSDAPCIEDQDCVVTHLKDGNCCSDPEFNKTNLYTRDQFQQLVAHQSQICVESADHYTCPPHPSPGHIETIFHGACVENRCVLKSVPAEAPHSPHVEPPTAESEPAVKEPDPTTPTVASPSAER